MGEAWWPVEETETTRAPPASIAGHRRLTRAKCGYPAAGAQQVHQVAGAGFHVGEEEHAVAALDEVVGRVRAPCGDVAAVEPQMGETLPVRLGPALVQQGAGHVDGVDMARGTDGAGGGEGRRAGAAAGVQDPLPHAGPGDARGERPQRPPQPRIPGGELAAGLAEQRAHREGGHGGYDGHGVFESFQFHQRSFSGSLPPSA
ncbi:hypothetical protein GCM10017744_100880 [Streptomyces antimycoticus]